MLPTDKKSPLPTRGLGPYNWITDAVVVLKRAIQNDCWASDSYLGKAVDGLLSGVPVPPEDLGFNSPADRYARAWKALNETDFKTQGVAFGTAPLSASANKNATEEALLVANDILRSCFAVAERMAVTHGTTFAGTNWGSLHEQISKSLDQQFAILKPRLEERANAAPQASRETGTASLNWNKPAVAAPVSHVEQQSKIDSTSIPSQRLASSDARPDTTPDEPSNGETLSGSVAPRSGSGEGVSQADSRERPAHSSALPSALRRFEFDRIRGGVVMAEGIAVEATNLEEATIKAGVLLKQHYPSTDTIRLRDASPSSIEPSVTSKEWAALVEAAREEGLIAGRNEILAARLSARREQIIEECAKVCDAEVARYENANKTAENMAWLCAEGIRALKSVTPDGRDAT